LGRVWTMDRIYQDKRIIYRSHMMDMIGDA